MSRPDRSAQITLRALVTARWVLLGLLAATGLLVACCSVLCWYPVLAPPARRTTPPPLRWAAGVDRSLQRLRGRALGLVAERAQQRGLARPEAAVRQVDADAQVDPASGHCPVPFRERQ